MHCVRLVAVTGRCVTSDDLMPRNVDRDTAHDVPDVKWASRDQSMVTSQRATCPVVESWCGNAGHHAVKITTGSYQLVSQDLMYVFG